MITCHVRYVIDPYQLTEFEAYAKAWLGIVERLGGIVTGVSVVVELVALGGRQRIAPHPVHALWAT